MIAYSDLLRAVVLYREALEEARDCCGCSAGSVKECQADILTGNAAAWPASTVEGAQKLLEEQP